MDRARATAGTLLFLVLVPGVVAGVIPWALTGWEAGDAPGSSRLFRVVGAVVLVAGIAVLLEGVRPGLRSKDAGHPRRLPPRSVVTLVGRSPRGGYLGREEYLGAIDQEAPPSAPEDDPIYSNPLIVLSPRPRTPSAPDTSQTPTEQPQPTQPEEQ
ncbi:MAG: hypothetical protein M5U27_08695 [Gaiella sp.]|nr:hypothetical protein [Gaiella sp.]